MIIIILLLSEQMRQTPPVFNRDDEYEVEIRAIFGAWDPDFDKIRHGKNFTYKDIGLWPIFILFLCLISSMNIH